MGNPRTSLCLPCACATGLCHSGKWPLLIRLIPELPVSLLLGRDWPGFLTPPTARTHCHNHKKKRLAATKPRSGWFTWPKKKGMLPDEPPQVRHPHLLTPVYSVFHQVAWEGNLGCGQKEDA